jgi:hypothetical protein
MAEVISEKAARVLNLLEQIDAVNEMIELHEGDSFMLDQYIYRKEEFVKDLVIQLGAFNIEKDDLAA